MEITRNALSSKLSIWNDGASRSRLTILRHEDEIGAEPLKIAGTRFISFGRKPANELRNATNHASWNTLDAEFEGGFSSSLWQHLRRGIEFESAEIVTSGKLTVQIFGVNNARVTLIEHSDSAEFSPVRIGKTSVIALNPLAMDEFSRMVRETKKAKLMEFLQSGSSMVNRIRSVILK